MSTTDPNTPPNPKQLFGDKKPPVDEFPLSAMILASLAGLDGDNKYGFRNWRDLPVEARTYAKAAVRHIRLWEEGEEFTRDTSADPMKGPGVHNLGAAIMGLAILIDAQVHGTLIDNRSKSKAVCDLLHDAEASVAYLNGLQVERNRKKAAEAEDGKPETPAPGADPLYEEPPVEEDGFRTLTHYAYKENGAVEETEIPIRKHEPAAPVNLQRPPEEPLGAPPLGDSAPPDEPLPPNFRYDKETDSIWHCGRGEPIDAGNAEYWHERRTEFPPYKRRKVAPCEPEPDDVPVGPIDPSDDAAPESLPLPDVRVRVDPVEETEVSVPAPRVMAPRTTGPFPPKRSG